MKIKITFTKKASGKIEALIRCVDKEPYPYSSIFPSNHSIKEVEKMKNLDNGYAYMHIEDDPDKIEAKVEKVVNKIKELLQQWKKIPVPADKEYIFD